MGGPRVTSGTDSKQDYASPSDLMAAIDRQFGPISFDLAAHAVNKKHSRYFAPPYFVEKYDPEKDIWGSLAVIALVQSLVRRGALEAEAGPAIDKAIRDGKKTDVVVPNRDKDAYALDAFEHSWAALSREFRRPSGAPGLLYLNCEFGDIAPWAERSKTEMEQGANSLLLTPAAVGSNWARDQVLGRADVYLLNGRVCFDGKSPFPKDCMLSHFSQEATGSVYLWDWKRGKVCRTWNLSP